MKSVRTPLLASNKKQNGFFKNHFCSCSIIDNIQIIMLYYVAIHKSEGLDCSEGRDCVRKTAINSSEFTFCQFYFYIRNNYRYEKTICDDCYQGKNEFFKKHFFSCSVIDNIQKIRLYYVTIHKSEGLDCSEGQDCVRNTTIKSSQCTFCQFYFYIRNNSRYEKTICDDCYQGKNQFFKNHFFSCSVIDNIQKIMSYYVAINKSEGLDCSERQDCVRNTALKSSQCTFCQFYFYIRNNYRYEKTICDDCYQGKNEFFKKHFFSCSVIDNIQKIRLYYVTIHKSEGLDCSEGQDCVRNTALKSSHWNNVVKVRSSCGIETQSLIKSGSCH